MLSLGYLGQLVTDWAGAGNVRRLQARFATLVNVGDVLICRGVVKAIAEPVAGPPLALLDVWAENQRGEKVTAGEAEVYLAREAGIESTPG
jgi:acyl dehydratase